MSTQVDSGDILRIVVKLTHPYYSQIQNVFHMILLGGETVNDTDLLSPIQDFLGAVYGAIDTHIHQDTSVLEWGADIIEFVADHWEVITSVLAGIDSITGFTPAATGDPLPPASAGLLLIRPDTLKYSNRKFFAPFTEVASDSDGEAVSSLAIGLAAAGSAFFDEYPLASGPDYLQPCGVDTDQELHRFFDSAVAKAAWAYQRRRKRYVGI
jgi:hypothetical protein